MTRWTPAGVCEQGGLPPAAAYLNLAFSPDGRTLWASPSSRATDDPRQYYSDVLDPVSGAVSTGPGWDARLPAHPGGGLVATLRSDQAATLVVFARAGHDSAPAAMRVLRQALILDADGYEAPVFSADGRRFAIRGNAYENSLAVFRVPLAPACPSDNPRHAQPRLPVPARVAGADARLVDGTTSRSEPSPACSGPGLRRGTWLKSTWTISTRPGTTCCAGSPVTALSAALAGNLVAATGEGDLVLMSVLTGSAKTHAADARTSRALVTTFLDRPPPRFPPTATSLPTRDRKSGSDQRFRRPRTR